MKKLSIIVPVYNTKMYLKKCINSILAQTISDIEIILVDDGSQDGSAKICDAYATADVRVKVIHKKNGGLSDARNAGINIAEGEYIGFVDSDDFVHPKMYELLLKIMEDAKSDIAQCEFVYFEDGQNPEVNEIRCASFQTTVESGTERIHNFYTSSVILHSTVCNKVYRKRIFEDTRFPVGQYYEDSAVLLRTIEKAERIAMVPMRLYYYRQRTGSIMHSHYSPKWFQGTHNNNNNNLVFFRKRRLFDQEQYALADYCTRFCKDKLAVTLLYPEYKKNFDNINRAFKRELVNVCRCPRICRLKKTAILSLFMIPRLSYWICRKWFPECLYEFMR